MLRVSAAVGLEHRANLSGGAIFVVYFVALLLISFELSLCLLALLLLLIVLCCYCACCFCVDVVVLAVGAALEAGTQQLLG